MYETVVPPLDERDFEKTVVPIVQEYFEHADTNEVAVSVRRCSRLPVMETQTYKPSLSRYVPVYLQELLAELNLGRMRSEVPSLAVSLALEAKASQRELTSRLLAHLCGPVLSRSDMENSFDKLLRELPDLVLDTPGAPQVRASLTPLLHVS